MRTITDLMPKIAEDQLLYSRRHDPLIIGLAILIGNGP
jgi:hypothetical protein